MQQHIWMRNFSNILIQFHYLYSVICIDTCESSTGTRTTRAKNWNKTKYTNLFSTRFWLHKRTQFCYFWIILLHRSGVFFFLIVASSHRIYIENILMIWNSLCSVAKKSGMEECPWDRNRISGQMAEKKSLNEYAVEWRS